jgi:lipopolysaccharide biosynthesis protein
VRVIAFYLPQFHPIPENDAWWGPGFTEWRNVVKARPLFPGHYQPRLPADLGFYDLRVPEVRTAQAEMARAHGVEAFCYWHYWFAGRRMLERPLGEVLRTGEPDFPFCLAWANQSWTGVWHGLEDKVLIAQTYPGPDDDLAHFRAVQAAFLDPRYLTVDGKPLVYVHRPRELPDPLRFTDLWRALALEIGLKGLYFVAEVSAEAAARWEPAAHGFDASVDGGLPPLRPWQPWTRPIERVRWEWKKRTGAPTVYRYPDVCEAIVTRERDVRTRAARHLRLLPDWDNTPRSGGNGLVLHGSTPDLFRRQVRAAVRLSAGMSPEERLLFLKSWNEWAEGNYVEPDVRFGRGYLEVLRDEVAT